MRPRIQIEVARCLAESGTVESREESVSRDCAARGDSASRASPPPSGDRLREPDRRLPLHPTRLPPRLRPSHALGPESSEATRKSLRNRRLRIGLPANDASSVLRRVVGLGDRRARAAVAGKPIADSRWCGDAPRGQRVAVDAGCGSGVVDGEGMAIRESNPQRGGSKREPDVTAEAGRRGRRWLRGQREAAQAFR